MKTCRIVENIPGIAVNFIHLHVTKVCEVIKFIFIKWRQKITGKQSPYDFIIQGKQVNRKFQLLTAGWISNLMYNCFFKLNSINSSHAREDKSSLPLAGIHFLSSKGRVDCNSLYRFINCSCTF